MEPILPVWSLTRTSSRHLRPARCSIPPLSRPPGHSACMTFGRHGTQPQIAVESFNEVCQPHGRPERLPDRVGCDLSHEPLPLIKALGYRVRSRTQPLFWLRAVIPSVPIPWSDGRRNNSDHRDPALPQIVRTGLTGFRPMRLRSYMPVLLS